MSKGDQSVIILMGASILLYLAVCISGYLYGRQTSWISFLNLLTAFALIIYWVQRELKITQHYFGLREIAALSFEILVIAAAVYFVRSESKAGWIRVSQYVFFIVHLLVLIVGLLFMLTFKMNKLM